MVDVYGGLRHQVRRALTSTPGGDNTQLGGLDALGSMIERLLVQLRYLAVDPLEMLNPVAQPISPSSEPLGAMLRTIAQHSLRDAQALKQLDNDLGDVRRELDACYELHQLRQDQMLADHLEEEDLAHWLESAMEGDIGIPPAGPPADYPAEELELGLRFRASVWHLIAGLRACFKDEEHDGWIQFELSLMLTDEFRRRHIQESSWATQEIKRAVHEGNADEKRLWEDFQRSHDARFQRWWQLFGPIHGWLTERLELSPDGLDKVFDAIGDEVWELSMPELLDRARDLLV